MAKEKDVATAEAPTTNDALADALLKAMERMQPASGGLSAEQLETVLKSSAEATRKALKPENAQHPDVSAFNPEGERDHPRPKLRRKTFWAGTELDADELDRDEIELMNSFEHSCEARNGAWRADLKRTATDGTAELHFTFPSKNTDDRMDLPSMKLMLRELHGGTKAVDPDSLAKRVAELEKQLAGA